MSGLEFLFSVIDGFAHEYDWQFHGFCPCHDDRKRANRSLSVTFKWSEKYGCVVPFFRCRQCGAGLAQIARKLGFDQWHLLYAYEWEAELIASYGEVVPELRPSSPAWNVPFYESRLTGEPLERLCEWRGLTPSTVRCHRIGLRGDRYALPVYAFDLAAGDRLVGLVTCEHGGKPHLSKGSQAALYPDVPDSDWILIVEGIWDAILGRQYGLPTVTGTAGADTWLDEWSVELSDVPLIYIAYDCDNAGRRGAQKVKASIPGGPDAKIIDLAPRRNDGYDVSDHLRKHQSAERLMSLIKRSK